MLKNRDLADKKKDQLNLFISDSILKIEKYGLRQNGGEIPMSVFDVISRCLSKCLSVSLSHCHKLLERVAPF